MQPSSVREIQRTPINLKGLMYLFVVYIIWGSTYLAIRIGVNENAGFPPFTLGTTRVLIAGSILIIWAGSARKRLRPTRREWLTLVGSGLLLWPVANGLVLWAEQRADSSIAALLVAVSPIWAALIEAVVDRRAPSARLILSLLVGLSGIALLSAPVLIKGVVADLLSILALLLAGTIWASGSLLQHRKPVGLSPQANSGFQHLVGSVGFLLVVLLLQEPSPDPTPEAWAAWGYLIFFGSIIGFTAFTQALRLLPASIAMTYAYVNPVIAIFLGWLILNEPIDAWKLGGTVLILFGVSGVFRERYG